MRTSAPAYGSVWRFYRVSHSSFCRLLWRQYRQSGARFIHAYRYARTGYSRLSSDSSSNFLTRRHQSGRSPSHYHRTICRSSISGSESRRYSKSTLRTVKSHRRARDTYSSPSNWSCSSSTSRESIRGLRKSYLSCLGLFASSHRRSLLASWSRSQRLHARTTRSYALRQSLRVPALRQSFGTTGHLVHRFNLSRWVFCRFFSSWQRQFFGANLAAAQTAVSVVTRCYSFFWRRSSGLSPWVTPLHSKTTRTNWKRHQSTFSSLRRPSYTSAYSLLRNLYILNRCRNGRATKLARKS